MRAGGLGLEQGGGMADAEIEDLLEGGDAGGGAGAGGNLAIDGLDDDDDDWGLEDDAA